MRRGGAGPPIYENSLPYLGALLYLKRDYFRWNEYMERAWIILWPLGDRSRYGSLFLFICGFSYLAPFIKSSGRLIF